MDFLNHVTVCEALTSKAPKVSHIAAAFCGRMLRDLGAQVTRIAPDGHDPVTPLKTVVSEHVGQGGGMLDVFLNNGKNRVALPLDTLTNAGDVPPELASANLILTDSVALSDRMEREVGPSKQSIVVLHPFPIGADENSLPVEDISLQGLAALADLMGDPTREPLKLGGNQAAYIGGYAAFAGAMGALAGQQSGRPTGRVTLDLFSANCWVNWKALAAGAMGMAMTREGKDAEWPILRCQDGYVALIYTERDWAPLVDMIGDPRLNDPKFSSFKSRAEHRDAYMAIIAEWCAGKSKADLYDRFQQAGVPGGPVFSPQDLLTDPLFKTTDYLRELHGDHNQSIFVPSIPVKSVNQSEGGAPARPAVASKARVPASLPLSGVRIVDLGIITAGAGTSALLADMGADVIKVESSSYPDPFRAWAGASEGDSPLFKFNNRNKRGVDLDLKTDESRASLLDLVATADIVVENFRRGVLDRLGIGFETLRTANPRIVLGSISGQGETGPGSGHTTFGSTLEALSGISALTGHPGDKPVISGRNLNYPDQIVCLFAAGALVAGYLKAQKDGCALHLSIPQREISTYAIGEFITAASQRILPEDALLTGNQDANAALQGIYASSDGKWISMSAGSPDAENAIRKYIAQHAKKTHESLDHAVRDIVAKDPADMVIGELRALGVAAFAAHGGKLAFEEAGRLRTTALAKSDEGTLVKGFPCQFANSPMQIYCESPTVGADTDEVIAELKTAT